MIPIFISSALRKEPLIIFGDGKQTRDYTYVGDFIRGYGMILDHFSKLNGEAINFGTGIQISIKDIAEYMAKKLDVEIKYEAPRFGEVAQFICNYDKAKKLLNWEPKISTWEGIAQYINWRKN